MEKYHDGFSMQKGNRVEFDIMKIMS